MLFVHCNINLQTVDNTLTIRNAF